jgi:hypothetical protein
MQEKFQVAFREYAEEGDPGPWMTDKSARVKKNLPGREGLSGGDPASKKMDNAVMYNSIPPGMDIEDQEVCDIRVMNYSMSGSNPIGHNAGDVHNDEAVSAGYVKRPMSPIDEMYTGEHTDPFYGELGFSERNNYLDRL